IGIGGFALGLWPSEQFAGPCDVVGAGGLGQQAVVADAEEALGQDVDEESADELVCGECHALVSISALDTVVLPLEGDAVLVECDQAAIGDLAATAAKLSSKPGTIDFEAVEHETVQRQRRALRFKLRAGPEHGGPSACTLAVADVAEIAAILNWRGALELGGPEPAFNIPVRTTVSRRIAEGAL